MKLDVFVSFCVQSNVFWTALKLSTTERLITVQRICPQELEENAARLLPYASHHSSSTNCENYHQDKANNENCFAACGDCFEYHRVRVNAVIRQCVTTVADWTEVEHRSGSLV